VSDIDVTAQDDHTFAVRLEGSGTSTRHAVVVPDGYPATLGCAHVETAELVRMSFEFLLEREPATSILRRFSLEQITDYFPEYPAEIGRRCS
jgi:hypothetical protein